MESWNEMTYRHSKEKAALDNWYELEVYKQKMQDNPDLELVAAQKTAQDKAMIARHYAEAKAHPSSPDLDASWDEYFRPKHLISMDEFMAQQKTQEQKILEEVREAVARKPKGQEEFELLEEQLRQQQIPKPVEPKR